MSEIRMELVTYDEAREICETMGYSFIDVIEDDGKIFLIADNNETDIPDEDIQINQPKNTVVFTQTSTGKMYVANKNSCGYATTFNIAQAKKFKTSDAIRKAFFMTKRGSHKWLTYKIS